MDGNKRTGHAALEITLVLNGMELTASVDAADTAMLAVASDEMDREVSRIRVCWMPARPMNGYGWDKFMAESLGLKC